MKTLFTPPAYGIHRIIKQYGNFPLGLPLPCYFEHGVSIRTKPSVHELATQKKVMLVFNKRRQREYLEFRKNINVQVLGAPFVHYRKMNGIVQSPEASGTTVFPAHATERVDALFDFDSFCSELNKLADDYKPIRICLHWYDLQRGKDKEYIKRGFDVVSAGEVNSTDFAKNFYSILSGSKYTCSNDPGSYTFYSIEMGIPFFLIGVPAVFVNDGKDPNNPDKCQYNDSDMGKFVSNLFNTGPAKTITEEQKRFVLDELGVNDCLTSQQLHDLLWESFWKTSPVDLIKESIRFFKGKMKMLK